MTKGMEKALTENGYRKMIFSEEQEGYRIYYDIMKSLVNAVIFVDAGRYNTDFINSFRTSMTLQMSNAGYTTHYMTVVCLDSHSPAYTTDLSIARQVCSDNAFSWVYDVSEKRIYIYENQVDDFYGLKGILDSAGDYEGSAEDEIEKEYVKPTFKEQIKSAAATVKTFPKVTTSLVVINVLIFIICTLTGTVLYNKGAAGLKLIDSPIQLYRVITSMFLHMGITHLFSNMLLLAFLGNVVEKEVKPLAFAASYFIAGIWGTLAMFIQEVVTDKDIVVVGASGAIFGLLGVLFALVIFKRVNRETMSPSRVFMVIILSVYNGSTQIDVANGAHVGGLIAGFLFGVIYCLAKPKKKGEI
ncbi:MAG: rhomboid family intramembrane serine protease, partial [Lachnospiraceae bacterium]|nr:rhomboid family intramembrane serine protease [Lachnospiraceae bacterium]